jgi:tetratricopeptide (TPR) repeat protein
VPHLDFGSTGEQQEPWLQLQQTGRFPTLDAGAVPHSYLVQEEWFELLQKAVKGAEAGNWYAVFQLGLNYFSRQDFERAEQCFAASLRLQHNPWCLYALGNVRRCLGDLPGATACLEQALRLRPGDSSLAKETLKTFKENNDCLGLERCYALLPPSLHRVPMLQFLHAYALANLGSLAEAERILLQDGGLQIPDLREGECSLSELYVYIQCEKARRADRILDPAAVPVPPVLDFRMNQRRSQ